MRGALLITCITVAGAHQARPPPLSGWEEVRSDHFRLRTDLPTAAARVRLGRLETLRAALQSAWMVPGDTPDSADVVVLGDTTEILTFTDCLAPPELVAAVHRDLDPGARADHRRVPGHDQTVTAPRDGAPTTVVRRRAVR